MLFASCWVRIISLSSLSCRPQKQQGGSGVDRQTGVGGQQALTVMVQGQGQTTGQLQVIPHGVTVIPGPGQQLMQAALPNGQVQRFLFTPSSAGMGEKSVHHNQKEIKLLFCWTHLKDSKRSAFSVFSIQPAKLHFQQNPSPAGTKGCCPSPSGGSYSCHHQHSILSQPPGAVTPSHACSYAHPVSHLAAGQSSGGHHPAAADPAAHQRVRTAAASAGENSPNARRSSAPLACVLSRAFVWAGTGPVAGPAEWRLSATAHQTATSHSDTAEWLFLSSNWTGIGSVC